MKKYLFPALFLLSLAVLPAMALAQGGGQVLPPPGGGQVLPNAGGGTSYQVPSNSSCDGGSCSVQNPLGASSFCGLIKNLLQAAIAIGIPIAVLFIVYAGFKFVIAQGNPEKLSEARKNLLWTLIGIAIFLGAWLLASVVANTVNALGGQQNIISCR